MQFLAWLAALAVLAQPSPPAPDRQAKDREIEVQAIGCVSGDTLTETNLNRGSSSEGLNPARRWRLRLTKEQRAALREVQGKQVEVTGVARESEVEAGRVIKSARAGRGRVYVGTESSRSAAREQVVVPTLTVSTFKARSESCR
jgi:hypothetical protein